MTTPPPTDPADALAGMSNEDLIYSVFGLGERHCQGRLNGDRALSRDLDVSTKEHQKADDAFAQYEECRVELLRRLRLARPAASVPAEIRQKVIDVLNVAIDGWEENRLDVGAGTFGQEAVMDLESAGFICVAAQRAPTIPTSDAGDRQTLVTIIETILKSVTPLECENQVADAILAAGYTTRRALAAEIRAMDLGEPMSALMRNSNDRLITGVSAVVEAIAQEVERNAS